MSILNAEKHNTLESGRSFSLTNLVYRTVWNAVWLALASWTPPPMQGWRRFLLRAFGAKISRGAGVYGSARVWSPKNLEMGAYAFLGPHVICYNMAKVTLGYHAIASQGAHICAGTHDIEDPNFQLVARPIFIGSNVWIAADAFVGPGVTLGDGAVLGARAVAFKNLDPETVYVGNPAKAIRKRTIAQRDKTKS